MGGRPKEVSVTSSVQGPCLTHLRVSTGQGSTQDTTGFFQCLMDRFDTYLEGKNNELPWHAILIKEKTSINQNNALFEPN